MIFVVLYKCLNCAADKIGLSLENRKTVFLISYLAAPRPTLTLNDMLNKKNYMLKMMLLHPNLGENVRVVFKLCSLLITTLTYYASKT